MEEKMTFSRQQKKSRVTFRRAGAGKLRRFLEKRGETDYKIWTNSERLPGERKGKFLGETGPLTAGIESYFRVEDIARMLALSETGKEIEEEMKRERKRLLADHEENCAWREASAVKDQSAPAGKAVNLRGGFLCFTDTGVWWQQLQNTFLDNMDEILSWLSDPESGRKEIFRSERQEEAVGAGIRYRNGCLEFGRAYRSRLVLVKEEGSGEPYRFQIAAFYPEG